MGNKNLTKAKKAKNYQSIEEIRKDFDDFGAMIQVLYLDEENLKKEELLKFLQEILLKYSDILTKNIKGRGTNMKRLIRIYDWLKYCKK